MPDAIFVRIVSLKGKGVRRLEHISDIVVLVKIYVGIDELLGYDIPFFVSYVYNVAVEILGVIVIDFVELRLRKRVEGYCRDKMCDIISGFAVSGLNTCFERDIGHSVAYTKYAAVTIERIHRKCTSIKNIVASCCPDI